MKLFRRNQQASSAGEEGALPPLPVAAWRVPPMGSMGDAWDSEIELPKKPDGTPVLEAPAKGSAKRTPAMKRQRYRRPAYNEVVFIEYLAPIHWAVIIAWVFVVIAFFSTGPLYPLMALFALGGVLSAISAVLLLRTVHRESSGEIAAYSAAFVGLMLIIIDFAKPANYAYQSYFTKAARKPVASLEFPETMKYTENSMQLMARIAWCAFQSDATQAIGIGRNSVNREVSGDPEYFGISTLAYIDPGRQMQGLEEEFLLYRDIDLPRDPFARDPRATFGVYITNSHIIVYSMGPDSAWQINPRQPVDRYAENPEAELAAHRYNPAHGRLGIGDIILIIPMEEFDKLEGLCEFTKQNLEKMEKTGELPDQLDPPSSDDWYW